MRRPWELEEIEHAKSFKVGDRVVRTLGFGAQLGTVTAVTKFRPDSLLPASRMVRVKTGWFGKGRWEEAKWLQHVEEGI